MLDLAEGLCKIAQVGKSALGPDLAGAQAGGQQQPGGFFNAVLFHILDGRGTQQLPETAQAGAFAQGHTVRNAFHGQFLGIVFLHKTQHLFHALGRHLLLPGAAALAHRAVGREGVQRRRKQIPNPVLVVVRFFVHSVPGLPQPGQNFRLPGFPLAQQKIGRYTGLQQRPDELLPVDGVHPAHEPRVEHPAAQHRGTFCRKFHCMEHAGVDEHALAFRQTDALFVHAHGHGALVGEDILKILMPVPRHRIAGKPFFVARNREQCAAVLHQLPSLRCGWDAAIQCQSHLRVPFRVFNIAGPSAPVLS